jgi:hypothetical protein
MEWNDRSHKKLEERAFNDIKNIEAVLLYWASCRIVLNVRQPCFWIPWERQKLNDYKVTMNFIAQLLIKTSLHNWFNMVYTPVHIYYEMCCYVLVVWYKVKLLLTVSIIDYVLNEVNKKYG